MISNADFEGMLKGLQNTIFWLHYVLLHFVNIKNSVLSLKSKRICHHVILTFSL